MALYVAEERTPERSCLKGRALSKGLHSLTVVPQGAR
jgi:hypothetical protein